jgi:hypothetical protein
MSKAGWLAAAGGAVAAVGVIVALPEVIAVGAVVAVGAAAAGAYEHFFTCQVCGARTTKLETLSWDWLSEDLRQPEHVCSTCIDGAIGVDFRRYANAIKHSTNVSTYSARYKGQVPHSADPTIDVAGAWFFDKDDAEKSLKVTAGYLGKNFVSQVKEERRSVGDTPVRSEWRYVGVAGRDPSSATPVPS